MKAKMKTLNELPENEFMGVSLSEDGTTFILRRTDGGDFTPGFRTDMFSIGVTNDKDGYKLAATQENLQALEKVMEKYYANYKPKKK